MRITRDDDIALFYIIQSLINYEKITDKQAEYMSELKARLSTISARDCAVNRTRMQMYEDIVGKLTIISELIISNAMKGK